MKEFFKLLKKEHVEIKGILQELIETKKTKKREELFHTLRIALVPHMKAEESAFYTPLMKKDEAREDAMEGLEEHHVSELVLKELEKMPKDEEQWGAKIKVYKEIVEHHIKEEESKIFKSAKKTFKKNEVENIMKKFDTEKKKILKGIK